MLRLASLYYVVISVSGTVVLETDGSFSVLGKGSAPADTLRTVNDRTDASELTANG